MNKKSVEELITILNHQVEALEEQESKLGKMLYVATDISKENTNEVDSTKVD